MAYQSWLLTYRFVVESSDSFIGHTDTHGHTNTAINIIDQYAIRTELEEDDHTKDEDEKEEKQEQEEDDDDYDDGEQIASLLLAISVL